MFEIARALVLTRGEGFGRVGIPFAARFHIRIARRTGLLGSDGLAHVKSISYLAR